MITRRGQRIRVLLKAGFLPFEAKELSIVNMAYVPWFKKLVNDRSKELASYLIAGKEPLPDAEFQKIWREHILEVYKQHGWYKPVGLGRVILDAWRMARTYEDAYKGRNPRYESPWEKLGRKRPDFLAMLDRTIAKQRGLEQSRQSHRRTATA